jgi:hypothetical protein
MRTRVRRRESARAIRGMKEKEGTRVCVCALWYACIRANLPIESNNWSVWISEICEMPVLSTQTAPLRTAWIAFSWSLRKKYADLVKISVLIISTRSELLTRTHGKFLFSAQHFVTPFPDKFSSAYRIYKIMQKKQQAYKTTGIRFSYMFCSIAALSWALYTPPCRDVSAGDPASDADTSRCVSSTRGSFPKIVSPYIEVTVFTFDIANSCSRWALFFPEFWGLAPAAWMAYIYIDQRSAICMRVCCTLFILLPLFTLSLQPFNVLICI